MALEEDERLLEICKNVSMEQDEGKLTRLIRELNQELDEFPTKKRPKSSQTDGNARCASG